MFPHVIHGAEKDVYETTAYQLFPVGQKMVTPLGNVFRYTLMGGTIGVANKLYQSATNITGHQSQAAAVALAVGDAQITFTPTTTAIAVNEYARGTVGVEETDDLGHLYAIKSHPAASADATCVLTLEDGVTVMVAVAVAGGNVLTVKKNPWRQVIIAPVTTPLGQAAGIARVVIAATSGWGWMQTRGVANCLVDSTWVVGAPLTDGSAVAGALMASAAATDATVAICLEVAPDADFGHVYLVVD